MLPQIVLQSKTTQHRHLCKRRIVKVKEHRKRGKTKITRTRVKCIPYIHDSENVFPIHFHFSILNIIIKNQKVVNNKGLHFSFHSCASCTL